MAEAIVLIIFEPRCVSRTIDDRVTGNGTNGGKAESCGSRDHRGSGVRESGENLRVGLRGGRGRSNNCLRLKVLVSVRFFLGDTY